MFHNSFTPRFNSVRDELISSADDNEDTPESLILLFMEYQNKTKQKCIINISVIEMRDELTFSASDNEHAPESPILFQSIQNQNSFNEMLENNIIPKFNSVRHELTFSADDNDDAPDEPILFIKNVKCTTENK